MAVDPNMFRPEAIGLPSVREYSSRVEAAVLGVTTNAQARKAIGVTTERLAEGYDLLAGMVGGDWDAGWVSDMRGTLNADNVRLSELFPQFPNDGAELAESDALNTWFSTSPAITKSYLDVYQIAAYRRRVDSFTPVDYAPVGLLKLAIAQAGGTIGEIAGAAAAAAGDALSQAARGSLDGLGNFLKSAWPILLVAGLAVAGVVYAKKELT